jgi:hypothetical protein
MIAGHFAIADITKLTCFQSENLWYLNLAALGPDIFDKIVSALFGAPSRGIFHSLPVFVSIIALALLLRPWVGLEAGTISAGLFLWGSHLFSDFLEPRVLFWPFLGPLGSSPKFNIMDKLRSFYIDRIFPGQFWLDIFFVVSLWVIVISKFVMS